MIMITTSRNYLKNKPSFSQVLPQTDKKAGAFHNSEIIRKHLKYNLWLFFFSLFLLYYKRTVNHLDTGLNNVTLGNERVPS